MIEDLENRLIKKYNDYMLEKSIFRDTLKILPSTPQSFATFPTVIIGEISNIQNVNTTSTNRYEYCEDLGYRVTIYTKNITIGNKKYQARNVRKELQLLTFNFFMEYGFIRANGSKGEYPDMEIDRYDMVFRTTRNNWNGKIR